MSCTKGITYQLDDSFGPCLIYLERQLPEGQTDQLALNLHGATIREQKDEQGNVLFWHLQTLNGGAKIATTSGFTITDIQNLIKDCHSI